MKKTFSVFCVAMLLCAALVLPASAAVTPAVRMDGPVQAYTGETIGVAMYVQGSLGGVQGTITYDTAALDYESVSLRNDVVALGNTEDVTVRADESTGTIRVVCLSNVDGGTAPTDAWLTVIFKVLLTEPGTNTTVSLTNLVTSDMDGTAAVDVKNANTTVTLVDSTNLFIDMDGATIKTDLAKQGIRFQATKTSVVTQDTTLSEAGVVMLPTALLYHEQDLTLETVGKGGTMPAIAKTNDADDLAKIAGGESLFATLTNGTTGGRGNVAITARAYVKLSNGTVIYYSHNDNSEPIINTGEASKSVVEIARTIAAKEIAKGATDTLDGLETTIGDMTDEDLQTLLTFCIDNIHLLSPQPPQ